MLSYLHSFHAGNLADVHKHSVLAWVLEYLTRKTKPLSYIETHSGRALYNLTSVAALKTGEANQGILRPEVQSWFDTEHAYRRVLAQVKAANGSSSYPGSPMIAQSLLRPIDTMHLAELHPTEGEALRRVMPKSAHIYLRDGFDMANAICPPMPRRGLMLVDPSYEVRTDYDNMPQFFKRIAEKWEVGVLMLWYPILTEPAHQSMTRKLKQIFPDGMDHQVQFPAAQAGHCMVGSGLFFVNAPYGLDTELARLARCYAGLTQR